MFISYTDEESRLAGEAETTTSLERITKLAKHTNVFVVAGALRNPRCPEPLREKAALRTEDPRLRAALADRISSEKALRHLFSVRNEGSVAHCLASNPALPHDLRRELAIEDAGSWLILHALFFNPTTSNALRGEILKRINGKDGHFGLKEREVEEMEKWLKDKEVES